jgi:hypothetical protein
MDRKTSARIAASSLFTLGFVEVTVVMLLFLPKEFTSDIGSTLPWELGFAVWLSVIFGLSRLLAGYGTWSFRKWGIMLGITLSTVTLVVAPSVYRAGIFGIMDLVLTITALVFLLLTWFGNDVIDTDKKTGE